MKTAYVSIILAALAMSPVSAVAQGNDGAAAVATKGKTLYGSDGKRIAVIYRVEADGAVDVILEGKLVKVPASTVTVDGGKASTNLTKAQLLGAH
jgi:uncharacterized protein YdeI (BOF family)